MCLICTLTSSTIRFLPRWPLLAPRVFLYYSKVNITTLWCMKQSFVLPSSGCHHHHQTFCLQRRRRRRRRKQRWNRLRWSHRRTISLYDICYKVHWSKFTVWFGCQKRVIAYSGLMGASPALRSMVAMFFFAGIGQSKKRKSLLLSLKVGGQKSPSMVAPSTARLILIHTAAIASLVFICSIISCILKRLIHVCSIPMWGEDGSILYHTMKWCPTMRHDEGYIDCGVWSMKIKWPIVGQKCRDLNDERDVGDADDIL